MTITELSHTVPVHADVIADVTAMSVAAVLDVTVAVRYRLRKQCFPL